MGRARPELCDLSFVAGLYFFPQEKGLNWAMETVFGQVGQVGQVGPQVAERQLFLEFFLHFSIKRTSRSAWTYDYIARGVPHHRSAARRGYDCVQDGEL